MATWQFILTALTLVVGGVTLWLVFRQVQIMRRQQETMQSQSSLMQKQLQIMQKQDELMALQLSRRAELRLKMDYKVLKKEDKSIRGYTFSFYIHNKGNKSAVDHYWHILVPLDFSQLQRMDTAGSTVVQPRHTEQNGLRYSYYSGFASEPVYPTRNKLIGEISIGSIPSGKALAVLWKIISEDGAFPDVDYAELEVPLVEAN